VYNFYTTNCINCTAFHRKWTRFDRGVVIPNLAFLRHKKPVAHTIVQAKSMCPSTKCSDLHGLSAKMASDSVCTLRRLCRTPQQSARTGAEYMGECKVLQNLTTFDITGSLLLLAATNIIVCGNGNRHFFFFLILLVRDLYLSTSFMHW
jgi:hypothetical protein